LQNKEKHLFVIWQKMYMFAKKEIKMKADEKISISKALTLLKEKQSGELKKWKVAFYKKDGYFKDFEHDTFLAADPKETLDRELKQSNILEGTKKNAIQKTRIVNLYSLVEKTYKAIKIDTLLYIKDEAGRVFEIDHEINIPKNQKINGR